MNKLKAKVTIHCDTCCAPMKRQKSFTVNSNTQEDAQKEARAKIESWKTKLVGQNCKVCQSIVSSTVK